LGQLARGHKDFGIGLSRTLDQIREKLPPGGEAALKGLALSAAGRHKEALPALTEALRANPLDANLLHARGYSLLHLGACEQAVADCTASLAINSQNPDALRTRGLALAQTGEAAKGLD